LLIIELTANTVMTTLAVKWVEKTLTNY